MTKLNNLHKHTSKWSRKNGTNRFPSDWNIFGECVFSLISTKFILSGWKMKRNPLSDYSHDTGTEIQTLKIKRIKKTKTKKSIFESNVIYHHQSNKIAIGNLGWPKMECVRTMYIERIMDKDCHLIDDVSIYQSIQLWHFEKTIIIMKQISLTSFPGLNSLTLECWSLCFLIHTIDGKQKSICYK